MCNTARARNACCGSGRTRTPAGIRSPRRSSPRCAHDVAPECPRGGPGAQPRGAVLRAAGVRRSADGAAGLRAVAPQSGAGHRLPQRGGGQLLHSGCAGPIARRAARGAAAAAS
eukprot:scaffold561_cov306-Prasinococcus_capsulatus_cf.AAC.5